LPSERHQFDDQKVDLTRVYHEVRGLKHEVANLSKHVVSEDKPEESVLWRLKQVEDTSAENSKAIERIHAIPIRVFWIAAAAIITLTSVGVATLVWNSIELKGSRSHVP